MTMDAQLKERLVGASVLVLAGVLFIPMVLDGPNSDRQVSQAVELPAAPGSEQRTVRIDLNAAADPSVRREVAPANDDEPAAIDLTPAQEAERVATAEQPEVPVVRQVEEPAASEDGTPPGRNTTEAVSKPSAPWTVQVGSFSQTDNAEALAARLRGLEFPAYVSRFNDGDRVHYRVRVGGFSSRDAAQLRAEEIRGKTGEPASPVQNQ